MGVAFLGSLVFLGDSQSPRVLDRKGQTNRQSFAKLLTYFTHRITNAVAEDVYSRIATVQKRACGYRNRDHFKIAAYFHCGRIDLYPQASVTAGKYDESKK